MQRQDVRLEGPTCIISTGVKAQEEADDFVAAGSVEESSTDNSLPSSQTMDEEEEEEEEEEGDFAGKDSSSDAPDSGDELQGVSADPLQQEAVEREDFRQESSEEHAAEERSSSKARLSMASAFADILAHPGPSNATAAPILLGSKSMAKRQREEAEYSKSDRAAKKLRLQMRQRGHLTVPKKGEDPQQDLQDKMLMKVATRGVVQLFNAVSKAQRQQKDALAAGAKAQDAKLRKSTFFTELRGQAPKPTIQQPVRTLGQEEDGPLAANGLVANGPSGAISSGAGWDVLQDHFGHLQGDTRSKMKDWDRDEQSDSPIDEAMSGSESDGNDAW